MMSGHRASAEAIPPAVAKVLRHFSVVSPSDARIEVVRGGFSSAGVWRVSSTNAAWCLRRWPPDTYDEERIAAIHRVLSQVYLAGIRQVPVPVASVDGATLVYESGAWWELAPWMAGRADFRELPTERRLAAAMEVLARFHQAVQVKEQRSGPPPGLAMRRELLGELNSGGFAAIRAAVLASPDLPWYPAAEQMIALFPILAPWVAPQLDRGLAGDVPLQICIRDLWHDHVLFRGDEVTGLVDFGAMRIDHVAADLSRLLESFLGEDQVRWEVALAEYQRHRRLTDRDLELVWIYQNSGVFLSGWNWLRWLYLERRDFFDMVSVRKRIEDLARRQASLAVLADLRRPIFPE